MTAPDIQVVEYDTLLDCLAAYFKCDIPELKTLKGNWEWTDWQGDVHSQSMKAALVTLMLERKVWGWLEDKHTIHIWVDKSATPKQVIRVLAHELGHSHRPFHRNDSKEEQKAALYAEVAETAFDMMGDLVRKQP